MKQQIPEEYSTVDIKIGGENIEALRFSNAILGTLRLNRFDCADSLCCTYLIDRFSQFLTCEVALHFINT